MNRPPAWCAQYVGKPFAEKGRGPDGYDCWGLARAVLMEQFGAASLPDYRDAYSSTGDKYSVSAAVDAGKQIGFERLPAATSGAVIILRLAGRPWHCGIAVDEHWMLHVVQGANVVLERLDSWAWSDRIEGFYRHV